MASGYRPGEVYLKEVAECLGYLPLAAARELAGCFGKSVRWTYAALGELQRQGAVDCLRFSVSQWPQRRWWLTGAGEAAWLRNGDFRHSPQQLARLVDNPLSVEWFYYVCSQLCGEPPERRLLEFSWFRDRSFEAAARFSDGWVALAWSGYWQNRAALVRRFERMSESMVVGDSGVRVWPSLFCFVVPDRWQAALVTSVAESFGMADAVCVCAIYDNILDGALDFGEARGWLLPQWDLTLSDGHDWGRVYGGCLASEPDGAWLIRLLQVIEQWPGIRIRTLCSFTRGSWKRVRSGLDRLAGKGLIWEQDGCYAVEAVWLSAAARRDRVWSGLPGKHFSKVKVAALYSGRIARHEQGLMRVMRAFAATGCAIAPGWRALDVMGSSGQIAPDGVVWLEQSPYGPGWHYVEYELRARSVKRVADKVRGYQTRVRADAYPVLVVCQPKVEAEFWAVGGQVPMLTTSVGEAAAGPLVGAAGTVWRCYGEPVAMLG